MNATTRRQHPNAPLTQEGRRRMVDCVVERGWRIEATAARFQVDAKTVRKWRDRFLAEGDAGLVDRSSRPHRSPNRTPRRLRRRVLRLRLKHLHQVPDNDTSTYSGPKGRFAWEMTGAIRFETPVPYRHPQGAVIWVRLDPAVEITF